MSAVAERQVQRKLVLQDAPPLVLATVCEARMRLPGHDENDILAMIEEGALPFAWDIALKPGRMAREFRIWPDCIEHYARTGGTRRYARSFESALHELLGRHGKPFITSNQVRLQLNCGPTHVINLVDAGQLKQLPGTKYKTGPNGAALVMRESYIEFLRTRLEGAV